MVCLFVCVCVEKKRGEGFWIPSLVILKMGLGSVGGWVLMGRGCCSDLISRKE